MTIQILSAKFFFPKSEKYKNDAFVQKLGVDFTGDERCLQFDRRPRVIKNNLIGRVYSHASQAFFHRALKSSGKFRLPIFLATARDSFHTIELQLISSAISMLRNTEGSKTVPGLRSSSRNAIISPMK